MRTGTAMRRLALSTFAVAALLPQLSCKRAMLPAHDPVIVEVLRVRSADASSTFQTTGDVHAKVERNLSFRVSGKVIERRVDVGNKVDAGAVLARLDARQQQADVRVAEATARSAMATLERATIELGRERLLFERGAIPKAALDAAERDHAAASSALAAAKAALDIAREVLSYTELRAAHAGVITARSIEVGQVIPAGAIAYALADDGPRDAVFQVDETVASRMAQGIRMDLALVDAPDVRAEGVIHEIAPTIDPKTASVRIKVAIDQRPAAMELGVPIVGKLQLTAATSFVVPASALTSDANDTAIWIVDPASKAVTLRRVVVASYESETIVIRDGLSDGDLIVARGSSRLRPKQVVRFAESSKT